MELPAPSTSDVAITFSAEYIEDSGVLGKVVFQQK